VNRLAVLLAAALLVGVAAPAFAKDHDHDCRECCKQADDHGCVPSKWVFYVARNEKCDPLEDVTRSTRALLCYVDDNGKRQRWKMLRWTPWQEAQFEADLRNAAICRED
jgi:hypothetical protein